MPTPFFAGVRVPVLAADEMRAWDAHSIRQIGIAEAVLMESAGRSVAAIVQRLCPAGRVVAVVGAGNNGGDALVVARTLRAWGREVVAVAVGKRPPDLSLLHGWEMEIRPAGQLSAALSGAAVVVDGLLGTGARGAPREPEAAAIDAIGRSGVPVVALDGPSGVDLTTGAAPGPAIRAAVTVTFGAPKRGLLLFPGREHAGRIVALEVGFAPLAEAGAELITPGWSAHHLPAVPANAHKGGMGRVLIVAGRRGMAGAAVLAGMGALRAGAGYAILVSPDDNRAIIQGSLPEALFLDRASLPDGFAEVDAVVAGPGMGTDDDSLALLRRLGRGAAPFLLDADALTLLARNPALRDEIERPLLLTPHPGEMGRLLDRPISAITADPFAAAAEAAERFRCTMLLKGSPSLVAETGSPTLVNVAGHSGIATGGMGDVLSGIAGALVAVGAAPREAAALALFHAGRAAEIAGRGRGLIPRDVAEALPSALCDRPAETSDLGLPGITLDLPPAR
ncbi:MAG TPA: NAD(P)H-hydrate dehydratase [Longimicrobium sp.]|jgi:NAD(P)H-hydrate epimerase